MLSSLTSQLAFRQQPLTLSLRFYDPLDKRSVILGTFFPANLLASTEENKPNAAKANIHPEHK